MEFHKALFPVLVVNRRAISVSRVHVLLFHASHVVDMFLAAPGAICGDTPSRRHEL